MSSLKIFTDGGARGNPGPAGIGVYAVDEQGVVVFQLSEAIGRATNNEAEYRAFLASLEWLRTYVESIRVSEVEWFLDSQLVVEQVKRKWKVKEPRLKKLAQLVWQNLSTLGCEYQITHVRRKFNQQADELVNRALDALE